MKKVLSIFITSIASLSLSNTWGQSYRANDTTIQSNTIEITQIYKPQVKQSTKESYIPSVHIKAPQLPSFEYQNTEAKSKNYSYTAQPIQPLAYTIDTNNIIYNNYVKVGLGNLRTLYLDAGISNRSHKKVTFNSNIGFLSQKGSIKDQKQTQLFLHSNLSFNKSKFDNNLWFNGNYSGFNRYAFDASTKYLNPNLNQTLGGISLGLNLNQKEFNPKGFKLISNADISLYTGSNQLNEQAINAHIGAVKRINNNWNATGTLNALFNHTNFNTNSFNSNIFIAQIGVNGLVQNWTIKAYLSPTIAQSNSFHLLPDISISKYFAKSNIDIGVGHSITLQQNSYRSLFLINPYLTNYFANQTTNKSVFAYLKTGIGNHFSLGIRGSWHRYNNFVSFVNTMANPENMNLLYIPQTDAFVFEPSVRYQIAESFSFNTKLLLSNYFNAIGSRAVWHSPSQILADIRWNPYNKITLTAKANYYTSSKALDTLSNIIKIKPFLDLGLGVEYNAMDKISFFLQLNNLLNTPYQRWWGYQSYGINVYGGARIKF